MPTRWLERRWLGIAVLVVVLVVTGFFGRWAKLERIDNKLEDNVIADRTLAAYYRFLDTFGNDRILLVGYPLPPVIDATFIRTLYKVEEALLKLDNVQTVLSPISPLRTQLGVDNEKQLERFLEEKRQIERYLENIRKTDSYQNVFVSRDWKTGGLVIRLKQETGDLVGPSIAEIRKVLDAQFPFTYHLTGIPEITRLILELTRRDQKIFAPLSVLLIALVLIVLYRSWFGVVIPLLTVVASFVWTKGLLMMTGHSVNFVTSILPPMITSISLTYCIHVLTDYFQESRDQKAYDPTTVRRAISHVARPIMLSSLTTVIGFGSLLYNSVPAIIQFGIFSSVGVIVSMSLSLLVLPAGIVATRRVGDRVSSIQGLEPIMGRIAWAMVNNPGRVWVVVAVLLALSVYGLTILPIETSLIRYLPEDHPIQDANRFVESNLGGIVPIEILLESSDKRWTDPDLLHRVRRLQEDLAGAPLVDKTLSYVNLVQDFDRLFSGEPNHVPPSEEEIRDYLLFYCPAASEPEDLATASAQTASGTAASATATATTTVPATATATGMVMATVASTTDAPRAAALATWTELPRGGLLDEFLATDSLTAHISLRMRDRSSRELTEAFAVVEALARKHFAGASVTFTLTGRAYMWAEVAEIIAWNEITSFGMSLLVISLIIMIQFRSIKLGLTAMIPNVLPLIYTYGTMGLTGTTFNTVTGMIASIAIGLAVDDTIHIIFQYKHELWKDGREKEALVRTMVHKGRATCFASVVLCGGFLVLTLSGFGPTRYFGIFISFGVAAALLCELLITPVALLTFKPVPIPEPGSRPPPEEKDDWNDWDERSPNP